MKSSWWYAVWGWTNPRPTRFKNIISRRRTPSKLLNRAREKRVDDVGNVFDKAASSYSLPPPLPSPPHPCNFVPDREFRIYRRERFFPLVFVRRLVIFFFPRPLAAFGCRRSTLRKRLDRESFFSRRIFFSFFFYSPMWLSILWWE